MFENVLMVLAGMAFLIKAADLFVEGAVAIARRLRVPEYAIGATLVALGTSLPEMCTSVYAAWAGHPEISLGNVIGSNFFNIGIVFGFSALLFPMVFGHNVAAKEWPHLVGSVVVLFPMAADGRLTRLEGVILLGLGAWYLSSQLSGRGGDEVASSGPALSGAGIAARLLAGMLGFVLGARWLVDGASGLARLAGIPEWIIALTVVAAGTSLPEVVTSLYSAWRGQRGISVGNVIGSNILNIYAVLGAAAITAPHALDPALIRLDLPMLLALTVLFLASIANRYAGRAAGLAMIAAYAIILTASIKMHGIP